MDMFIYIITYPLSLVLCKDAC